jgi:hypothetical protein
MSSRPRAAAASTPGRWCGPELTADDTSHEVENGTHRFHAIYMVPSAGADRLVDVAPRIQANAHDASALLERLYGRAIRFDLGTRCGPRNLDISLVRTRATAADFATAAGTANGTLKLVATSLRAAGFPTLRSGAGRSAAARLTTNYVVWLDAPAPEASCGVADLIDDTSRLGSNWNNYGGKVATIFRSGDSFCGPQAVRHEIGHTLGALQPGAPHAVDGAHCNDAFEDTMCTGDAPVRGSGIFASEFFDYGNDDYWDPPAGRPLGWWTVNLSRFICRTADCNSGENISARPPASPATYRRAKRRSHARRTRSAARPKRG